MSAIYKEQSYEQIPNPALNLDAQSVDPITELAPGIGSEKTNPLIWLIEDEQGGVNFNILKNGIDHGSLAIIGLRKSITERRLRTAEERVDALPVTAEAHKVAAEILIHPNKKPNESDEAYSRRMQHTLEHQPVTFRERRQSYRNANRLRKNMNKASATHGLEQIYGGTDSEFGSSAHRSGVESARMPRSAKRSEIKASRFYEKNMDIISGNYTKVEQAAAGTDKHGNRINQKMDKNLDRTGELRHRLIWLEDKEEQKLQALEDRDAIDKSKRKLRKLGRQ